MAVTVKDILDVVCFGTDVRLVREKQTKNGFFHKIMLDPSAPEKRVKDDVWQKMLEKEVITMSADMDILEITYKE